MTRSNVSTSGSSASSTGSSASSKRTSPYPRPSRGHWTVAEAARAWGLSTGWVRQLIARGRIEARLMTDAPSAYWAIDVEQPHPARRKRAPVMGAVPGVRQP